MPERHAVAFSEDMIQSWEIDLTAEKKAARTRKIYRDNLRRYRDWLAAHGLDDCELERHDFAAYLADLVESKQYKDTTVAGRHVAVRAFSKWLAAEEDVEDVLLTVSAPKVTEKVTPPFTDAELQALFGACKGVSFRDRRDEAICRLMAEAGPRASGVVSMTVKGTSLAAGTAVIVAKGGNEYVIGFGPQTARALDRYLRMRRSHKLAGSDAFWLGERGTTFSYPGLYKALRARAEAAGVTGFHPHRFRHTMADRWLDKGGSEGGLMAVAGWKNRKMVDRYAKARAAARALDEARRLGLGDL